jgi:hypothetical protein
MSESQTLSEYLFQFLPLSQRIKAKKLLTEDDLTIIYSKAEKEADDGGNLTESFRLLAMEYMILKQFYSKDGDTKKIIVENLVKTWLREFDMGTDKFTLMEPEHGSREEAQNVNFIVSSQSPRLNEILELFEGEDKRVRRMVLQLVADSSDYGIKVEVKEKRLLFSV